MENQKKTWEKPQLIVLARGTPEESVLTHCKTMNPNQPVSGQLDQQQDTCAFGTATNCRNCQSRAVNIS